MGFHVVLGERQRWTMRSAFLARAYTDREVMSALVDGTARLQTIDSTRQPRLHELLRTFAVDGRPAVLLNTSLNLAGEPIVETPADAVDVFLRLQIDVLVLEDVVLAKQSLDHLLSTSKRIAD